MKRGKTVEWAINEDDTVTVRPMEGGPFVCLTINSYGESEHELLTPEQAKSIGKALIAASMLYTVKKTA